jgi:Mn-dependent DtxR family transcriptional regulator
MKVFLLSLITFTQFFCLNLLLGPTASAQISGEWINTQKGSVLSEITILEESGRLYIDPKGSCQGCNTGRKAVVSATRTSQGVESSLSSIYQINGEEVRILASLSDHKLTVKLQQKTTHGGEIHSENFLYTFEKKDNTNKKYSGSISGSVIGRARSTASIFQISLYGPDNGNRYVSTHFFSRDRTYKFENLPDGTYYVTVESKGSTAIVASPDFAKITVENGKAYVQDVELK